MRYLLSRRVSSRIFCYSPLRDSIVLLVLRAIICFEGVFPQHTRFSGLDKRGLRVPASNVSHAELCRRLAASRPRVRARRCARGAAPPSSASRPGASPGASLRSTIASMHSQRKVLLRVGVRGEEARLHLPTSAGRAPSLGASDCQRICAVDAGERSNAGSASNFKCADDRPLQSRGSTRPGVVSSESTASKCTVGISCFC